MNDSEKNKTQLLDDIKVKEAIDDVIDNAKSPEEIMIVIRMVLYNDGVGKFTLSEYPLNQMGTIYITSDKKPSNIAIDTINDDVLPMLVRIIWDQRFGQLDDAMNDLERHST